MPVKKVNKRELYKIAGGKVERPKHCPRCGLGIFLATHSDRTSCGKCGYTEFLKK